MCTGLSVVLFYLLLHVPFWIEAVIKDNLQGKSPLKENIGFLASFWLAGFWLAF